MPRAADGGAQRQAAALIALDWGSTNLRAALLDGAGQVLDQRRSDDGAARVPHGGFEAAYRALAADWLDLRVPALACGMVGSTHGWAEAPYLACPARPAALAGALASAGRGPAAIRIVPGLCVDDPATPDVMRGEETQIVGLLHRHPEFAPAATLVMPGTHSKWVDVRDGGVAGFATRMTGELFAVLRQHSVLGRLMADGALPFDAAAFDRGVDAGRRGGAADLGRWLFGVRALGLRGGLTAEAQPDYLSGLLIGAEVAAGLAGRDAGLPLVLVGEAALCERYRRALAHWQRPATLFDGQTTVDGLWVLARAAGLLGG